MKRFFALMLAMLLALACLPALADNDVTTFTIWAPEDDGIRNAAQSFFWDYVSENTGVKLEVIGYSSTEQVQMMLANREFPDMLCGGRISADMLLPTAMDGDLLDLGQVIEEYSPTMKAFYEKNTILYNSAKLDGKLYTLPVQIQEPKNAMRDQWMYCAAWLEEVGKAVPTTMDELMDVLEAIKAAAGTGTIPADVYPLYFCFDSNVGGQFDIFAAFGVLTGCNKYYTVADADGNIINQAINPDIIPALEWIQEAVQKGLIPVEAFTNAWADYLSIYDSYPPVCFLVTAYSNANVEVKHPMDVPANNVGKPNYIRSQSKQGGNPKHAFTVFNTKNVQAHVAEVGKMIEFCAQPTTAMTEYYGKQEIGIWWQNEDGTYSIDSNWNGSNYMQNHYLELGPNNRFFCVLPTEFYETQYTDPDMSIDNSRGWAYVNLYKDNLADWDPFVYAAPLDEDDTFEMNDLYTAVSTYRKQVITQWLTTDADIRAEWDGYVAGMKDAGAERWLELTQKAYDLATGR